MQITKSVEKIYFYRILVILQIDRFFVNLPAIVFVQDQA